MKASAVPLHCDLCRNFGKKGADSAEAAIDWPVPDRHISLAHTSRDRCKFRASKSLQTGPKLAKLRPSSLHIRPNPGQNWPNPYTCGQRRPKSDRAWGTSCRFRPSLAQSKTIWAILTGFSRRSAKSRTDSTEFVGATPSLADSGRRRRTAMGHRCRRSLWNDVVGNLAERMVWDIGSAKAGARVRRL